MKKVLYIGNLLSDKGFSPTTVELLGPRLQTLGYEVTYAGKHRIPVFRWLEMLAALATRKYDLVLIDTYSTRAFYFAIMAAIIASLRRRPYYPILHGGNLPERLKNKWQSDLVFKRAQKNVAVSTYLLTTFKAAGYPTTLVHNFLDIPAYAFQKRHTPLKAPSILWVRSFNAIYNPLLALDILQQLRSAYPTISLGMVGPDKDGSMQTFTTEVVRRGLEPHVQVFGKLGKAEWHQLSRKYNIFLNTTHIDNSPVSVVEAMALGLPVVSTKVGGIPYMISDGENGLLYEDSDAKGAVQAILRLMNEPGLVEKLSVNGRKEAEKRDWSNISNQWIELLG